MRLKYTIRTLGFASAFNVALLSTEFGDALLRLGKPELVNECSIAGSIRESRRDSGLLPTVAGQIPRLGLVGRQGVEDRLRDHKRRIGACFRVFHGLSNRADLILVELEGRLAECALECVQLGERLAEDRGLHRRDLDQRHVDVPLTQLEPERVADRPQPELRRAVRAVEREDEHPSDRPDVDDPAAPAPDQRHEGLDHGYRPEEIDLQLLAEVRHRLELDRRRDPDARVVDDAGEAAIAHDVGTPAAAAAIVAWSVTSMISGVSRSGA